jgi:hypothetical protein
MSFTALVQALGSLTFSGVGTDTQTVVINGKTYTTQTVLTNVDGNVLIGANAAATLQNLFDAINLTGTPGTQYAAAMTIHPDVYAFSVSATVLVVKSKVPGAIGNLIPTTETQTNAAWGGATLAGGSGSINTALGELLTTEQMNASVSQNLRELTGAAVTS